MKKIEVFDPALCCNSGVCGTDVDQALVTFSADVDWLKQQGGAISRYNLSQQPMVFVENPGRACLSGAFRRERTPAGSG